MATNDKIREQEDMQMSHYKSLTPDEQADRERSLMDKARADTTSKHIGAIWNWWATKPQKSKNNATIRIITRTDIEELVRLIK